MSTLIGHFRTVGDTYHRSLIIIVFIKPNMAEAHGDQSSENGFVGSFLVCLFCFVFLIFQSPRQFDDTGAREVRNYPMKQEE